MKNFRHHIAFLLQMLLVLTLLAGSAGAALLDVGPVVPEVQNSSPPAHGFPLWYRDLNRVPTELCLSQTVSPDPAAAGGTMCNLLPAPGFDPAQPLVFPTNFPDEAFWWAGDAQIKNGFIRATVVMAVEAAWGTGVITPGKQITFARIRFIVDTPVAGTYRIVFPYGVRTFNNVPAGVHAIFHSEDVGVADGIFDGALQGGIGPFLSWDSGPVTVGTEQFLGDPNIPHTITGSPLGTNYFRIEGPVGSNLDGLGNNFVQTNLFSITGKLLSQAIPTPLTVDKATYALDNTGMQVNAFATTQAVSNQTTGVGAFPNNYALTGTPSALQFSGAGIATQALTTNSPADGKFFAASSVFAAPLTLPTTVSVTNTADIPDTVQNVPLVDEVMISAANYNPLNKRLTLTASSLDQVNSPALQAFMPGMSAPLGTLAGGALGVTFPVTDITVTPNVTYPIPPATITVTSAKGGSTTAALSIAPVTVVPAAGATLTPGVASPQPVGTPVTFTAAAVGGDAGLYEYRFWYRSTAAATYILGRAYAASASWVWDTAALGLPVGSYYVAVEVRHVGSNAANEARKAVSYNLTTAFPATSVTMTPSLASPQVAGTAITFTGLAGGGDAGPYEYRFWYRSTAAATYTLGRAYAASASWVWDTAALGLPAGSYYVAVEVRHVGSNAANEARKAVSYNLKTALLATSVTMTPSIASPQVAGTAITFTGAAGGGDAGPYEYRFWYRSTAAATYTLGRAYAASASWVWDTAALGLPVGSYYVAVDVRHVGSNAANEARKAVSYQLNSPFPATSVTMTPSLASPQLAGTAITFTGLAGGGDAGPYEYRFWYRSTAAATYTLGRAYAASASWAWDTAALGLPAGSYYVAVEVRHVGSKAANEARKAVGYRLVP